MIRATTRRPIAPVLLGLVIWTVAGGASFASVSGIHGRVEAGPTCPVEQQPPQRQCAPRPLSATLKIHPVGDRSDYVLVHSGQRGWFRTVLAPGTYVVRAQKIHGSALPRPPAPFQVTVRRERFTSVTVNYDTGIR